MPYIVNKSNGQELTTIGDRTINDSSSSLTLIGKNYAGYGEFLNENYVKLLENFANSTAPNSPIDGQLWWDTSTTRLNIRTGSSWKTIANLTTASTTPANSVMGDLWWDSTQGLLKAYNGTSYVTIGPVEELPGAILDALNNFLVNGGSPSNTGTENNFIGLNAGESNTTGNGNNFFGSFAGNLNTTGSNNLFLGKAAGSGVVTGSNNTIIGTIAGSASLSNTFIAGSGSIERLRVDNTGLYVNGVPVVQPNSSIVGTTDAQTLTNKTISVDDNTVNGIAASSFVLSNSSGAIDGLAAQKAIPAGEVVGTTDAQALTNKTISADNNAITGIAASSFVLSNSSGVIDGSAAQKAIPAGAVVGTNDSQTLTNKTISGAQNTLTNINLQSSVTGTLPIANGGTGGTNRTTALNSLLPSQTNNAGKVLVTDGTDAVWQPVETTGGTVTSVGINTGTTGLTVSNSPIVTNGNISLGGTLSVAHGGTGSTTVTGAINNLLPSQVNNQNRVLSTNGSNVSWVDANPGTVTSISVSGGSTGLITSGGPVTSAGTITLSGTLNVANGGTGATTTSGAINNLLPTQTGNSGRFLTTNGSGVSWATITTSGGSVTSVGVSGGTTGLTTSGGPITSSGTITLGGTLGISNGGTGATTINGAINNLLPTQTGNSGRVLSTNGNIVSWITPNTGTVTSISVSGGSTGLITSGGPVTSSGTITLAGTLLVSNGGTGATSLTGVVIGNGTSAFTTKTNPTGAFVGTNDSQTLTNKTISVDDNTVNGIAASSFVLSNSSGAIDGSALQKAIPAGAVVGTTDAQTLTNKTLSDPTLTGNIAGTSTFTGSVSVPTQSNSDNSTRAASTAFVKNIMSMMYPVGSIYTNATNAANPSLLLGFGTWVSFGAGRVPVGFNGSDASFDVAEKTGGSKDAIVVSHTHTFSASGNTGINSADHSHYFDRTSDAAGGHAHTVSFNAGESDASANGSDLRGAGSEVSVTTAAVGDHTHRVRGQTQGTSADHTHAFNISGTSASTGSAGTNANLPPYITVYMWKRTA